MNTNTRPFAYPDQAGLTAAINTVCAECRFMRTSCFQPTPAWLHALEQTACPRHLLLLVEDTDEGQIVGWCRFFPLPECNGLACEVELGIGLLLDYRGRGLGKALVGRGLNWAAAAGIRRVTLTTRADNVRALCLFRRFEFVATGSNSDERIEMTHYLSALEE